MAEGGKLQTNQGSSLFSLLFPISAAIAVRSVVAAYSDFFDERVEFTSPVYSFERLKDGVAMLEDGLDPFEAKNMHFPPLTLHLFRFLLNTAPSILLPFWILLDVGTAYMTAKAAETVWRRSHGDEESQNMGNLIFSLYAFNPITIISIGILSLTVLQNAIFAAIFLFFVTDRPKICAILIGAWSSFTIYPFILISCLAFGSNVSSKPAEVKSKKSEPSPSSLPVQKSITQFLSLVFLSVFSATILIGINFLLNRSSLNFIEPVYMSILQFSNIQPNVGLYWYFFVQIFEHFRSFYTRSFVILYFFMPIPITLMIRRDSVLHFTIIGLLVSIFFPYPTLNQVSLVLAILPLHRAYKKHFRYTILIAGTIVSTIALMPVMWHMWMVSSSGNANFFFGATIVYNVALINMVMDMIFVYSRQQIDLNYSDTLKQKTKMDFAVY